MLRRKMAGGPKPVNPILREIFPCYWKLPKVLKKTE